MVHKDVPLEYSNNHRNRLTMWKITRANLFPRFRKISIFIIFFHTSSSIIFGVTAILEFLLLVMRVHDVWNISRPLSLFDHSVSVFYNYICGFHENHQFSMILSFDRILISLCIQAHGNVFLSIYDVHSHSLYRQKPNQCLSVLSH